MSVLDFAIQWEHNGPIYLRLVAALLNCKVENLSEPTGEMLAYIEEVEEMWELPSDINTLFELGDNVTGEGMSYGYVCLFEWRGKKYVGECNASPYLIYEVKE